MLKVLHICYGVGTGGVEAVIYNYYRYIDHEKIHFDVIAQRKKDDYAPKMYGDLLKDLGCKIFFVPPKSENIFKNLWKTASTMRRGKYDILHIHMGPASFLYVLLGKLLKIKGIIVHVHGAFDPTGWNTSVTTKIQRKLLGCLKGYKKMACSRVAAEQLWGEDTHAFILHNAFEIKKFCTNETMRVNMRKKLGIQEKFAIVDVARLSEEKQPFFMIDIFSSLKKMKKNSVLFMVGTGKLLEKTKEYARSCDCKDSDICFLGARTDVADILQAMDAFVLPTRGEGLGIAYIEAQAAGLPCFAPEGKVPQEVAITPLFHEVKDKENPQAWANMILTYEGQHLHESPQQLLRKEGYDICKEANRLEQYYANLVEEA